MRTKEELERLNKRVERWGKLTPEEQERRMRIWRHNSLLGHVAMARSNMRAIETVSTTSARAREIAGKIRDLLEDLDKELRETRIDPK